MSFYKVLSKYYDVIFPSNPVQMDFIKKFALDKHLRILDIAAGSGNQAIEFARLGHEITAIDLDAEMVSKIQEKSKVLNLDRVNALQMDMKNIHEFQASAFDLVICIGNSIVHLDSIIEINDTIAKMYRTLADHGSLIIQIVNYDRILKHQITELPIIERKDEGITFIRTYEHTHEKIIFNGKLHINQNQQAQTFQNSVELYPLTSSKLKEGLHKAGFQQIKLYGDFKGNEHSIESPALIAVAQK